MIGKKALLILLLPVISCKSRYPVIQFPVRTVERKVTTLVPITVPGDSILLRAVFECDSTNKVILKELSEEKSKNMCSSIEFERETLEYKTGRKTDTVYVSRDTIFESSEIPVFVPETKTEYRQKWYQKLFFYIGLFGSIALILYIIIKIKIK